MNPSQKYSQLLIISHTIEQFQGLSSILRHYFSPQKKLVQQPSQEIISIANKYYTADVELTHKNWAEVLEFTSLPEDDKEQAKGQIQVENGQKNVLAGNQNMEKYHISDQRKYDFMIMLVNQEDGPIMGFENLDAIIEKYNPDEFLLLINTNNPQAKWKHEDTVLEKCNNFIEIVKENLSKVFKHKPNWARGTLLNDEEEDQTGIFSILDRIQTTRWSTLVNVKQDKKKVKATTSHDQNEKQEEQKGQKIHKNIQSQLLVTPSTATLSPPPQTLPHTVSIHLQTNQKLCISSAPSQPVLMQKIQIIKQDPFVSCCQEQQIIDESTLQQQMAQFESMMGQMLAFKNQSAVMNDSDRKNKAEELFSKMFNGMMNQ